MLADFQKFFASSLRSKFALKSSLNIQPRVKRVTTLPCEMCVSENERKMATGIVINEKSQGSVATRLQSGETINNHFSTDLLLSESM